MRPSPCCSYRVCLTHSKQLEVEVDGAAQRFCQQVGRTLVGATEVLAAPSFQPTLSVPGLTS